MAEADPRKTFNVHDAKSNLSKLIDRAHAGEEIVIAKAGKPYARLMPLPSVSDGPRQPGRFKHLLRSMSEEAVMAPCFTEAEIEAFENASIDPDER